MLDDIFLFLNSVSQNKNWKNDFENFYKILTNYNLKINLTRIDDYTDFYIKHVYNSALCLKEINISNLNIFDIGTGAGFPGLVWKILIPSINLTLIESVNKKCIFLEKVIKELNLKNAKVINDRSEILSFKFNEKSDIVTARAVSNLTMLLEITSRFSKINSHLLFFKGAKYETELLESSKIIKELNLKLDNVIKDELIEDSNYVVLDFIKLKSTPKKYPRSFNKIKNITI
ncbi:16S rRNA (guanine(527)-N(7))-methyltransferase RsmG [Spiroplasma endosymbiont of Amphibalanus improvisus]|uniref:16S rRNA (guanine(527)-N(7))-methyltransferase RsmG n=1 Tax=Spiroplasma endosymbiont of Amphibalanus improvisus TaxID=3066327 RepID=UPI00313CC750